LSISMQHGSMPRYHQTFGQESHEDTSARRFIYMLSIRPVKSVELKQHKIANSGRRVYYTGEEQYQSKSYMHIFLKISWCNFSFA